MPTLASKQSRHQIRRPTAKDDYKVIFTDANLRTHHGGRVLKLEYHKSPQVTVLRCSGRIVQGDGADTLLRAVMSEDKRHILIDLIEVTAIDAAGLGALAELERWATFRNRNIHVLNPAKAIREALDVTGLSSVLRIVPAAAQKFDQTSAWQEFLACLCPPQAWSASDANTCRL